MKMLSTGRRGKISYFWWSQPSVMFYVGTDGRSERSKIATPVTSARSCLVRMDITWETPRIRLFAVWSG